MAPGKAVRLGLPMVTGLANEPGARLISRRGVTPNSTVEEIWRRAAIPTPMLERLAEADALHSVGLDRRQALRAVRGLADTVLPLFGAANGDGPLPSMREGGEVVGDERSAFLPSPPANPMPPPNLIPSLPPNSR